MHYTGKHTRRRNNSKIGLTLLATVVLFVVIAITITGNSKSIATPPGRDEVDSFNTPEATMQPLNSEIPLVVEEPEPEHIVPTEEEENPVEKEEEEDTHDYEAERQEAMKILEEAEEEYNTVPVFNTVNTYEGYFIKYMDLKNVKEVSTEDMDYLLDTIIAGRDSEMSGCGYAFIKAGQETELNPIFLLCLAAQEAGWTVSDLHAQKCNPYSINMHDDNINAGFVLGETFSEGIINGAIWINEHYYNEGQHTLYDFIYGEKRYASSDTWISYIVSNMNKCYKLLNSK